jgi:hypothetical protein
MGRLNVEEPSPVDRKSRLSPLLRFGRIQRRPEIDALRGIFLVWMTLTHLPTHFSDLVNEPFGFVSSAEGFVFLSALLVARLHIRQAAVAAAALRTKLWKPALRLYELRKRSDFRWAMTLHSWGVLNPYSKKLNVAI